MRRIEKEEKEQIDFGTRKDKRGKKQSKQREKMRSFYRKSTNYMKIKKT